MKPFKSHLYLDFSRMDLFLRNYSKKGYRIQNFFRYRIFRRVVCQIHFFVIIKYTVYTYISTYGIHQYTVTVTVTPIYTE